MNEIKLEQEQPLQHNAPALTAQFFIRCAFRAREDEAAQHVQHVERGVEEQNAAQAFCR